ncbi:MAG: hypothetical protein HY077_12635 [Elusimicrobia bacterium]|nr:hypothetical protein [Elusimicrobiota bacterium]
MSKQRDDGGTMKRLTRRFGWTAGLLLASPVLAASGLKAIARDLAAAARGARISRVAVLPFASAEGGDSREGWNIAERLTTPLVRTGKVQAVERQLLDRIMGEHSLGRTGLLDQALVRRIGKVSAAEGIVTGSYVTVGRQVVVNARLIDVETGIIIAACEREAERDWLDAPGLFSWSSGRDGAIEIPAPELFVEAPPVPAEPFLELRDAPASDPCANAPIRIDRMESSILDLKARYWALKLRQGLALSQIKVNPGSTISDPELKQEFYDRLARWYRGGAVPALSPTEVQRFVAVDQKAYSLYQQCGI